MPPKPAGPRKGPKFLDVKLFIAALALAVTLGVWNLLSTANLQVQKASAEPQTAPPPQADQAAPDLGPLPTLLPLVPVDTSVAASAPESAAQAAQPAANLRAVSAPDQTIVQKSKPVVQSQSQVVVVSGGGSSSGGGAVTTTRSSK